MKLPRCRGIGNARWIAPALVELGQDDAAEGLEDEEAERRPVGDGALGRRRSPSSKGSGSTRYGNKYLRVRFFDETVETLERVRSIVERVFGETATIQQDGRGSNGKHLCFTGRQVTGFFAAQVPVGSKTFSLAMPAFVWEGGRDLALSFLACGTASMLQGFWQLVLGRKNRMLLRIIVAVAIAVVAAGLAASVYTGCPIGRICR